MIPRAVILILALVCFGLSAADVRHTRINLQSLGLLLVTAALLSWVWGAR